MLSFQCGMIAKLVGLLGKPLSFRCEIAYMAKRDFDLARLSELIFASYTLLFSLYPESPSQFSAQYSRGSLPFLQVDGFWGGLGLCRVNISYFSIQIFFYF